MEAPQNVEFDISTGIMTWDTVVGADSYEVKISSSEEGPWEQLGTTTITSFSFVNAPMSEGYAIVAGKRDPNNGPWSEPPQKWERPVKYE